MTPKGTSPKHIFVCIARRESTTSPISPPHLTPTPFRQPTYSTRGDSELKRQILPKLVQGLRSPSSGLITSQFFRVANMTYFIFHCYVLNMYFYKEDHFLIKNLYMLKNALSQKLLREFSNKS